MDLINTIVDTAPGHLGRLKKKLRDTENLRNTEQLVAANRVRFTLYRVISLKTLF